MANLHASLLDTSIALYSNGRFSEALALLDNLASGSAVSAEILNIAAACARALGNWQDAERYWQRAVQAEPDYVPAHNNLGILLHQSRRLAEAEAAYRRALTLRPDYAEAHYNLGLLYQDAGKPQEALACYHSALRWRPGYAEVHNNLGSIHQAQGAWEAAQTHFRQAIALNPAYAEAHNNLGFVLAKARRFEEAAACCRQAISLRPELSAAHNNLGLVLQHLERFADAEECHRQALILAPDNAEILFGLGQLFHRSGRLEDAEICYQRALASHPDYVDALQNYGNLLHKLGRHTDAQACYQRALACRPESADLHNNLGVLFARQKRFADAEHAYHRALSLRPDYADARHNLALMYLQVDQAQAAEAALTTLLDLKPDHAEAWNSLGNLLQREHRTGAAEDAYRRALALRPDHGPTLNNLATLLQQTQRYTEAEACYRHAIAAAADYPEPRWNLGFLLLYLGRLEEGWPLMEARYDPALARPIAAAPDLPFPQWQGEDLAGKSIVVWTEQGFGDEIQFVRYVPLLKAAGAARVTLVCKTPLVSLLRSVAGADDVLDVADARPSGNDAATRLQAHDYWVLMLSLPLHCRTRADTIPAALPYLAADEDKAREWSKRLPAGGARVGLVWKGFGGHVNDANRSLPGLACLAPLWSVDGISLISLQRGMDKEPVFTPAAELPLLDLGADIKDFADTAAIVTQLDLVICVDTAVAHVAGALGKACWVLLPHTHPDWRWMEGRADSPWYPEVMKLYRQAAPGDWSSTVKRVADDLATWVKDRSAGRLLSA